MRGHMTFGQLAAELHILSHKDGFRMQVEFALKGLSAEFKHGRSTTKYFSLN